MSTRPLLFLSDNYLTVASEFDASGTATRGIFDTLDPLVPITSATVTAILEDLDGVQLTGISQPLSLPHAGSPDGVYRATVDKALATVPGQVIKIIVTIDDTGGTGLETRFAQLHTIEESV